MKDKIEHVDKVQKTNKYIIMAGKASISFLVNVKHLSFQKYYT